MPAPEVVAQIVRSGFVEGHHYGSVVALAPDGSIEWSVGDVESPVLPRSCNKPLQAVAMVEAGLSLPPALLAMACASHSGEQMHLEAVARILEGTELSEGDLQCPVDWPMIDSVRDEALRSGASASRMFMNCSGKHAAMLATCVVNGWDTATYLSPEHPLQRAIVSTFSRLTGEPVASVAVDGCGAPLLSTSLTGLARAFRTVAMAADEPETAVAEAIRTHPELVSGSTRDELTLLTAIPGAIGKAGAEACYAVALPDGRAFALKIDDGGARARPVVMAAALERSGVLDLPGADAAAVRRTGESVLLGGGIPVGEIRSVIGVTG